MSLTMIQITIGQFSASGSLMTTDELTKFQSVTVLSTENWMILKFCFDFAQTTQNLLELVCTLASWHWKESKF